MLNELLVFLRENWPNFLAVAWFLVCFRGYIHYASVKGRTTLGLTGVMHKHRELWILQALHRDNRVPDATTIANLERSVSFFASTTMLILAGLMTVLGSTEKAINVVANIPLSSISSRAEWELKILLLISLFVYAFFKFTWSLRQYGFASVMMGGIPVIDEDAEEEDKRHYALGVSDMTSMAGTKFNAGLRAYYFSMAVLGWFVNIWLFMLLSAFITFILYRREFKSQTLKILKKNLTRHQQSSESTGL